MDSGKRRDFMEATEYTRNGATMAEVARAYPSVYVQYHKGLKSLHTELLEPRNNKPVVLWFYGESGTGKSFQAWRIGHQLCGTTPGDRFSFGRQPYPKDPCGHWWDNYAQQRVVIIDDIRPDAMPFDSLLRIFDHNPLQLQNKGGYVQFNSPFIIITSRQDPYQMYLDHWEGKDKEDMLQLFRRITRLERFTRLPGAVLPIDVRRGQAYLDRCKARYVPKLNVGYGMNMEALQYAPNFQPFDALPPITLAEFDEEVPLQDFLDTLR